MSRDEGPHLPCAAERMGMVNEGSRGRSSCPQFNDSGRVRHVAWRLPATCAGASHEPGARELWPVERSGGMPHHARAGRTPAPKGLKLVGS